MTVVIIYGLLALCLVVSLAKSRRKTQQAFRIGRKALFNVAPSLLTILGIVGLTLGIVTQEKLLQLLGSESGFSATIVAALFGSITLIPSLAVFPFAASLLRSGATVMTISAFITTLVMVGVITAPMEVQMLGKKFTLLRNGLSFIAALIIAILMGIVL